MILGAVLASGSGNRMGSDIPKQFLPLLDKPVLMHTLDAFDRCAFFDRVFVVVPPRWQAHTESLIGTHLTHRDRFSVIVGGVDRTESLLRAIDAATALDDSDQAILVTHDGVRPFLSPALIEQTVLAAKHFGGATAAIPAVDTIAVSANGKTIDSTPDRSTLWQIQTPQTFHLRLLSDTLHSLSDSERTTLTDACGIFALRALPVHLVLGLRENVKLTTPEDLLFALSWLQSHGKGTEGTQ